MAKWTADPDCPLCHGSGIDPESKGEDHGLPYGVDPSSLEPCACIWEQLGYTKIEKEN